MFRVLITILVLVSSSCASLHYQQTEQGELHGKLLVQWIDHDKFIFIPDEETPLFFKRATQEIISPGRMYTDGGSIPRSLWVFRNYSPWGYAPAFIIHDWLFVMKHCQLSGYENYDVEEAAWVMAEVMKTMMQTQKDDAPNALAVYTMFQAVRSPIAAELWENGECNTPPRLSPNGPQPAAPTPIMQYIIEFP